MRRLWQLTCTITFLVTLPVSEYLKADEFPSQTLTALSTQTESSHPESQILQEIWQYQLPLLVKRIQISFSKNDSYVLYNIQGYTNVLLEYAVNTGNYKLVSELSELYLVPHRFLKLEKSYIYKYYPGSPRISTHPLNPPAKMWAHPDTGENILPVAQFLYLVSRTINVILDLPIDKRTVAMNSLVSMYAPVLKSHYDRWIFGTPGIFQVRGWGGDRGMFNHYQSLSKKLVRGFNGPAHCNAVLDTDMWIIAGVVELLAAQKRDPFRIRLNQPHRDRFHNYAAIGIQLLKSRLKKSALFDFRGNLVTGWNFDLGAWNSHPDYDYVGYTGVPYPTTKDKRPAVQTGWDIAHARRFVHVFETLHNNREVTGLLFPSHEDMVRFANQLLYGTFNRNFSRPLFTNFMDGTNGWYRVGYSGRKNFGYGPYSKSNALLTGGYSLWSKYNPDMHLLSDALWDMIKEVAADVPPDVSGRREGTPPDPDIVKHVRTYYSSLYLKPHSLSLMQFLASRGGSPRTAKQAP